MRGSRVALTSIQCLEQSKWLFAWLVLALGIFAVPAAWAADPDDLLDGPGGSSLDILDDLNAGKKQSDLGRLGASHLSLLKTWQGVRVESPKPGDAQKFHWAVSGGSVSPLDNEPISTLVDVPAEAKYRIYLRHTLNVQEKRPVTMRVTSEGKPTGEESTAKKPTGEPLTHEFGNFTLLDGQQGKQQESRLPIRVESQLQLNTFPDRQMPVWEYWDVTLPAGVCRVSLAAKKTNVQADAVLITQSTELRPSFAITAKDNTLQRVFVRFRLAAAKPRVAKYNVSAALTYHWRGRSFRSGEEMWGHDVGSVADVAGDAWSPFIDAAEAMVPGPGPWSTCRVNLSGVQSGKVEVQVAWYPHEAAVAHRFTTGVAEGQAMFRVPHGALTYQTASDQPRWGVWNAKLLKQFEPEEQLVERYFAWAQTAGEELGLAADHPRPKHLLFLSSCRVSPAYRERAAKMLARLGVNWIEGAPLGVVERLGLYDGQSMTKIKVGDEISTYTPASTINHSRPLLAGFHKYLQEQAKLQNTTTAELFGADRLDRIRCLGTLPENAGRFERRLYYHSHRYCHLATIPQYAKAVAQAEAEHKNAAVYNNYSPHPVFLTGNTMNTTDWFLLARAGAQTLGWGEDWATGGSWGLNTDKAQCVSFYAALVECSTRKHGYPGGFYVGSNMGGSAHKIFSCVAQGLQIMHLYDWGPIDAWAEGSNAWSENQSEYKAVMTATHALGPADEIIAKGTREPRRTAILYNRAHEIMNGGTVTLNHDWMWTYLAIKSAHVPVDVILEEDLKPEQLEQYKVLYLGGLNLEQRHLNVVAEWVRQGGLLIGSGGSAMLDAYNSENPATVELFGARQVLAKRNKAAESETVSFDKSDVFPAATFKVAAPHGYRYTLEPTTATPLGKYSGGACAAVTQEVGKGRTILLGFYPGYTYSANGRALGAVQPWFAASLLTQLGRQQAEFSYPAAEVTLFEHPSGIAVMLANFSPADAKQLPQPGTTQPTKLSVRTERPIREVISGLRGPLKWKRVGDRIEIETPVPADLSVDTVILR